MFLSDVSIVQIIIALAGIFAGGGLVALFKVGPQRKHIVVNAAEGAVVVQSGVLKDLREEISRLQGQVTSLEMEGTATQEQTDADINELHKQQREHLATIERLRMDIEFLHRDVDRHGRMTELARKRSHVLSNALGPLELRVHGLIKELTRRNIEVPEDLLPYEASAKLQEELALIADLEGKITYSAVSEPPPQ